MNFPMDPIGKSLGSSLGTIGKLIGKFNAFKINM